VRRLPAFALAGALLVAPGGAGVRAAPAPYASARSAADCQPGDALVAIQGKAFTPASSTIAPGTTVCWTNMDALQHTVTSSTFASSSQLNSGETHRATFPSQGEHDYACSIHAEMMGRVVVGTTTPPPPAAPSPPPAVPPPPAPPPPPPRPAPDQDDVVDDDGDDAGEDD
jgi:plastocyanin